MTARQRLARGVQLQVIRYNMNRSFSARQSGLHLHNISGWIAGMLQKITWYAVGK
jgi:hypothetical protein